MNLKHILKELKRRNVFKAALSYVVFSWVFIQAASILYPSFGWGQKAISNTLIVLVILFPLWIVFAYVFEWTPKGFKKTDDVAEEASIATATGKKMTNITVIGLTLAVVLLLADRIFGITTSETVADTDTDKSIAVLAFADMSPNKDQEYFSDGISEEILNLLAKVPDLRVISRTSSFAYKGKEENIKQIGEELNVGHILEGSIRKSGNTFRITAQLINVENGSHIWSETYDRDMTDIFKIQDEIAGRVTKQLKATLLGKFSSTTVNPEAYDLYLQARQTKQVGTEESLRIAEMLINQSISIDSTYAPAWEYLSNIIYNKVYKYGMLSITEDNIDKYMLPAKRAISLDPNFALGYATIAHYEQINWNFEASNMYMDKALELEKDNVNVITTAANISFNLGRVKESKQLYLKAKDLDPLNYYIDYNLGLAYWMLQDYENARKYLETYIQHYPESWGSHSILSVVYLKLGKTEKSLSEIEKEPDPFWKLYRKCMVVYAMGNTTEADVLLKQLVEDWGHDSWPNIASVYAFRSEKDEALKWLNLAYENRDGSVLEILNYPEFENIWGDPRWNAFLDKLGLPKDHGFHRD